MFIPLYASWPSRYLPQINFNDNVRFGFMLFLLEFAYIIQYLLEWRVTKLVIFLMEVFQSPSKIKKFSHLFLCKYSSLNFYWQEYFPGNFLVNQLMICFWQMVLFLQLMLFLPTHNIKSFLKTKCSCCRLRLILSWFHFTTRFLRRVIPHPFLALGSSL